MLRSLAVGERGRMEREQIKRLLLLLLGWLGSIKDIGEEIWVRTGNCRFAEGFWSAQWTVEAVRSYACKDAAHARILLVLIKTARKRES
mmetsp:Transcript_6260/g.12353  ORF Transcript_6260/g.12353 Transcript_6260/m.12353 type:complete len:89 (+) Transcript_6260:300-566(+)